MTSSTFRGREKGLSLLLLNQSFSPTPPPAILIAICDILQENSPFFFKSVMNLSLVSVFFFYKNKLQNYNLFLLNNWQQ